MHMLICDGLNVMHVKMKKRKEKKDNSYYFLTLIQVDHDPVASDTIELL